MRLPEPRSLVAKLTSGYLGSKYPYNLDVGHKSQDERYQYYDYYEYARPDVSEGSQSYYCELFEKRFGKFTSGGNLSPALAHSPNKLSKKELLPDEPDATAAPSAVTPEPPNKVSYEKSNSHHPHYRIFPDDEMPPRFAKTGPFSEAENIYTTMPALCRRLLESETKCQLPAVAAERPAPPLKQPLSQPMDKWMKWNYREYIETAEIIAKSLISFGVKQFGSVAIFAGNRPEWFFASLGASYTGGKTVGLYVTDEIEFVEYKLLHSDARVVFVDTKERLLKVLKAVERGHITNLVA